MLVRFLFYLCSKNVQEEENKENIKKYENKGGRAEEKHIGKARMRKMETHT
jgi:hypothetical protein